MYPTIAASIAAWVGRHHPRATDESDLGGDHQPERRHDHHRRHLNDSAPTVTAVAHPERHRDNHFESHDERRHRR
jgi:hypothetical protein